MPLTHGPLAAATTTLLLLPAAAAHAHGGLFSGTNAPAPIWLSQGLYVTA